MIVKAMPAFLLAAVATAALLMAAEPGTSRMPTLVQVPEPTVPWARGEDFDPYPMPRTEIYIGDLSLRADGRYVSM